MGNWYSIEAQEQHVKERMKDPDMKRMMGLFGPSGHRKYTDRQLKGTLRGDYHGVRKPNDYTRDCDLRSAGYPFR